MHAVFALDHLPSWHLHASIDRDGDTRSVGEDEFRFGEEGFASVFSCEEGPIKNEQND